MKTLGVIAQKGGTGKTTLSVHLAVQATLDGMRVLLLDMDPQASATAWWKRRSDESPQLIQGRGDALPDILEQAQAQGYDLMIADTAPHSSADSGACARLSDHVIIPTRPAILDLDAIGTTTGIVSEVRSSTVILLNACPPPKLFGEPRIVREAREALKQYGLPVCEVAISQRAAFSHALIDGRAVAEFDAGGKAAGEIARLWDTIKLDIGL
ncbi:MAG: ParA family protein [Pseudomonadota bacterium]|nr:ParA family protein [Pseudomonadota bacterium]